MEQRTVKSVAEMGQLAAEIGQQLQPSAVLYLVGELGAGKTTFVQGLAAFLGVTRPVTSSTFVLMSSYAVTTHPVIRKLVQVDLYRLTPEQVRGEAVVAELLSGSAVPERLTVVEWADRLDKKTTPHGCWIHFEHVDPTTRVVRWDYGPRT